MYRFLRDSKIQNVLNLLKSNTFKEDPRVDLALEKDIMKSTAAYFPNILNSGYKVLLYQGQFDFRDGIMGSRHWIENMKWKYSLEYFNANRDVWMTNDKVAGYVTAYRNLVRVELSNAGHLAPGDQGFNTAEMIKQFLL
jgi:vitellogenic carboxypeptidase-like protein